jgi:hypothetical protein
MTVKNPFWPASHARVAGEPGVNQHANRKIVPMKTSKNAALALIATAVAAAAIVLPAAADADPTPACGDGQVVATAGLSEGGAGHRGLILIFSLAPGSGSGARATPSDVDAFLNPSFLRYAPEQNQESNCGPKPSVRDFVHTELSHGGCGRQWRLGGRPRRRRTRSRRPSACPGMPVSGS